MEEEVNNTCWRTDRERLAVGGAGNTAVPGWR